MPFIAPLPHLTRPLGEVTRYRTVGGLRHSDGDVIPSGFRTDLASIPRVLHWLLPSASPYEAAAIRHDDGCNQLNAYWAAIRAAAAGRTTGLRFPTRDSRTVDRDFRHDLRDLGMGPVRRWMMWLGVRLGALASTARRPGSAATFPAVAALLLLNLWVVLPTLVCAAAVAALDLIERPTRRAAPTFGHDEPIPLAA